MIDFLRMRQLIKAEERLRWALEREQARATKSTATLSRSGGSGNRTSSKVEDGAVAMAILRDEYQQVSADLETQRKELKSELRKEKDELHRVIVRMRYLKGISCRQIAAIMNYSEDRTYHIISEAERRIKRRQEARNKGFSC